jgi:hypothetical protein
VEIGRIFLTGKYSKQVSEIKIQIDYGSYPIQIVSEPSKCDLYLAIDLIDSIFLLQSKRMANPTSLLQY